jgi:hypothetical protein
MLKSKNRPVDVSTRLKGACTAVGFTFGSLVFITVQVIVYIVSGVKIVDYKYPFAILFAAIFLLINTITYNIYYNKNRYQFIISDDFKPFRLKNSTGFTICILALILSFILFGAVSILIGVYL